MMLKETIALANDHAGVELKRALKEDLSAMQCDVLDLGVDDLRPVDYPDMGYQVAHALRAGRARRGVLICGSGIGISIAANRFREVRAALVHDVHTARLSRQHNDANVICFGARLIDPEIARQCLRVFLETEFEGGRHGLRVEKLNYPS